MFYLILDAFCAVEIFPLDA
jgi:hypothetical protein